MTAPPLVETTFRVGRRFKVTMTVPAFKAGEVLNLNVEWSPDVPKRRLNKAEWRDYRRGRDLALAEVARAIGGTVMSCDLERSGDVRLSAILRPDAAGEPAGAS